MRIATRAVILLCVVALLAGCSGLQRGDERSSSAPPRPAPALPTPTPTPTQTPQPQHSLTNPSSLWVIVNKSRPLTPAQYVPPDLVPVPVPHTNPPELRRAAAAALVVMFAAARRARLVLASDSAYRSYTAQRVVYGEDLRALGRAGADLVTARPGFSEHQTGLAVDIGAASGACSLRACFARTTEGRWLAAHAWSYGFVLRYPRGLTRVTGYDFEPWHYRYVGRPLASAVHASGALTLEQYFHLPAAPTY
jgi:zinc D-Ala-D-Ala carboxypeptidase